MPNAPHPTPFSQARAEFWGKATGGDVIGAAVFICNADLQKSYETMAARQAGGKVPHLGGSVWVLGRAGSVSKQGLEVW